MPARPQTASMPGMGTAPPERHYPGMPSPSRVVSRSVSVAIRTGMTEHQALAIIQVIAAMLFDVADAHAQELCPWVTDIQSAASERAKRLPLSDTDQQETINGDGSGSAAGCPEATAETERQSPG